MSIKEIRIRNFGIYLMFLTMAAMRILNWNTLPSFFKTGTVVLTLAVLACTIYWIVVRIQLKIAIKELVIYELDYLKMKLNDLETPDFEKLKTFNEDLKESIEICEDDIEYAKELKVLIYSEKKQKKIDNFITEAEEILKKFKAL